MVQSLLWGDILQLLMVKLNMSLPSLVPLRLTFLSILNNVFTGQQPLPSACTVFMCIIIKLFRVILSMGVFTIWIVVCQEKKGKDAVNIFSYSDQVIRFDETCMLSGESQIY